MKFSFKSLGIAVFMMLLAILGWHLMSTGDFRERHSTSRESMSGLSGGHSTSDFKSDRKANAVRNGTGHEGRLLGLPSGSNPDEVERKFLDKLQEMESGRIRLIGQQARNNKANGPETWYLIGIDVPDPDQIRATRELIREAMDSVEFKSRGKLDEALGKYLETYNALGTQGKRAAIISIPEDPGKPMIAHVFGSDDFESELSKLDPSIPFDYTFRDLKVYCRDDAKPLMRFSKIIK